MKSKKNRNDFVLILVLLAVILIGFLVVRLQRQKDALPLMSVSMEQPSPPTGWMRR